MAQAASIRTAGPETLGAISESRSGDTSGKVVCAFPASHQTPSGITGWVIQLMCDLRRDRRQQFTPALGSGTPWDVLLQLYAAHLNQRELNISRLTERVGAPPTSVLRALDALNTAGLVTRSEGQEDRRQVFVALSFAGVAAMNDFFVKSGARAVLL